MYQEGTIRHLSYPNSAIHPAISGSQDISTLDTVSDYLIANLGTVMALMAPALTIEGGSIPDSGVTVPEPLSSQNSLTGRVGMKQKI